MNLDIEVHERPQGGFIVIVNDTEVFTARSNSERSYQACLAFAIAFAAGYIFLFQAAVPVETEGRVWRVTDEGAHLLIYKKQYHPRKGKPTDGTDQSPDQPGPGRGAR